MKIISLYLENFKGVKQKLYEFDEDVTEFVAQNGEGKTTICDAWYWLWTDKDSELNSNPPIRPCDGRECIVLVTAHIEINGKPVAFSKKQKCKITEKDGVRKTALKNTFEINSVEKTEKACKENLHELGIDMDLFLQLSHPDMFLLGMKEKKTREQIRNTLFQMADDMTDLQVAEKNDELEGLIPLLTNYTVEEIRSIQASNMRAVKEHYGNKGEIIDAEIRGMQELIVEVENVSELELQRNALIEQLDKEKNSIDDKRNEIKLNELISKKSKLLRELSEEKSRLEIEKYNKKNLKHTELMDVADNYNKCNREIKESENKIEVLSTKISDNNIKREELGEKYNFYKKSEFDENEKICKSCGQELPTSKIEHLKKIFEENKKLNLSETWNTAIKMKQHFKELEKELENEKEKLKNLLLEKDKMKIIFDEQNKEFEKIGKMPLFSEKIDMLSVQIKDVEAEILLLNNKKHTSNVKNENDNKTFEIQNEINNINKKLSAFANNSRIEEKIDKLKTKKLEYAQQLAEAEKILYLLSLLDKTKNEMLSESINKHFSLIDWKLFSIQKNGEIKSDLCMPLIDGKELVSEANGALRILAKLDIIKSLQQFYGKHYPVFVDGFESVTSNTKERINMNCQLITLSAEEGVEGVVKK